MSKIKNSGLDHVTEPFEQQQFGTSGVKALTLTIRICRLFDLCLSQMVSVLLLARDAFVRTNRRTIAVMLACLSFCLSVWYERPL